MMKKLIITGIVATMVMGFAAMASAYDTGWVANLKTTTSLTTLTNSMTGTFKLATDATDPKTDGTKGAEDTNYAVYAQKTAYIKSVNGGVAAGMITDGRKTFNGVSLVYQLQLGFDNWAAGDATGIYLLGWNPANAFGKDQDFLPTNGETIKLYKVSDFGGSRELLWTVDSTVNGTGTLADANTWKSRAFAAGDKFELEYAAPVPEPGSMLALFSGLAGMVGYGIRRRK